MSLFLHLYHGRRLDPVTLEQPEMEDWGEDGPYFPCGQVISDYKSHLRLMHKQWVGDQRLSYLDDLIFYDGWFYGAFEVVSELPEGVTSVAVNPDKADVSGYREVWGVRAVDKEYGDTIWLTEAAQVGDSVDFSVDEAEAARFTRFGATRWIEAHLRQVATRTRERPVAADLGSTRASNDPWGLLLADLRDARRAISGEVADAATLARMRTLRAATEAVLRRRPKGTAEK